MHSLLSTFQSVSQVSHLTSHGRNYPVLQEPHHIKCLHTTKLTTIITVNKNNYTLFTTWNQPLLKKPFQCLKEGAVLNEYELLEIL